MGRAHAPNPAAEGRKGCRQPEHPHQCTPRGNAEAGARRKGGRGERRSSAAAGELTRPTRHPSPAQPGGLARGQRGPGQNPSCGGPGRGRPAKAMPSVTNALPAGSSVGRGSAGSDSTGVGGPPGRGQGRDTEGMRGERGTDMGFRNNQNAHEQPVFPRTNVLGKRSWRSSGPTPCLQIGNV